MKVVSIRVCRSSTIQTTPLPAQCAFLLNMRTHSDPSVLKPLTSPVRVAFRCRRRGPYEDFLSTRIVCIVRMDLSS
jgi:hypothetical protein